MCVYRLLLENRQFQCLQVGNLVISHREPNAAEARLQAMSVVAGCAKGIMYFESQV